MNQQWQPHPKDDPPVCYLCRHYDGYSCNHPLNMKFNPVSGRHPELKTGDMRRIGACGYDGKLFEPKGPTRWERFVKWFTDTSYQ